MAIEGIPDQSCTQQESLQLWIFATEDFDEGRARAALEMHCGNLEAAVDTLLREPLASSALN